VTRGWLPQRTGSPIPVGGGGDAAVVPPFPYEEVLKKNWISMSAEVSASLVAVVHVTLLVHYTHI